jgi:hypothetical protein
MYSCGTPTNDGGGNGLGTKELRDSVGAGDGRGELGRGEAMKNKRMKI